MRLTTKSRYGTRLMLDLAEHLSQGPVCAAEISRRQNIPIKYLEKIIHELQTGGFVVSKRGPKGGHMLAKAPDKISIGDIVRIMEGSSFLTKCAESGKICEKTIKCKMHRIWRAASNAMMDKLDSITLSSLLG